MLEHEQNLISHKKRECASARDNILHSFKPVYNSFDKPYKSPQHLQGQLAELPMSADSIDAKIQKFASDQWVVEIHPFYAIVIQFYSWQL